MKFPRTLLGLAQLLLLALVIFVGLASWNAYAEHGHIGVAIHDRDTIVVTGEGKVTAIPDIAQLNLGVQSDGVTVKQAQADNTKKMNAINAMLKNQGIEDKDITTENYSVYPKVDWNNGRQTILGYTVSQSVSVKVRDLDKVGDIITQAGSLGANQIGGINFTIDDPKALQAQARDKAIADAKQKAQQLTQQLGIGLGNVVTFTEGSGSVPGPFPYYAKYNDLGVSAEAAPAPTIQAGSQDVVSNVSVTFEVK